MKNKFIFANKFRSFILETRTFAIRWTSLKFKLMLQIFIFTSSVPKKNPISKFGLKSSLVDIYERRFSFHRYIFN